MTSVSGAANTEWHACPRAMVAGQAEATILDLSNTNKIMRDNGDRFNVLPMFEVDASDEALFANLDWIQANEDDVQIFVNALLSVWRAVTSGSHSRPGRGQSR